MEFVQTILITGASSGIGAATAVALAARGGRWGGVNLVLVARRMEKLQEVAAQCTAAGAKEAIVMHCDVSQREDVVQCVNETIETFGRLDVMIANAGYGMLAKIHEATEEQFDEIVATNVKGTWYAMQAAAQVMLKQERRAGRKKDGRGHIVAVSSAAGKRGLPLYGLYAMTKAAQLSLAQAMRVEMRGEGIYVSTVHPLTTDTEFFEVASSKSPVESKGLGHRYSAESVARKMVRLIEKPQPEAWPVRGSNLLLTLANLLPSLADLAMAQTVRRRVRGA
ncbi:MAG: SDR family oxidoreductase [Phycisphaerales bacterium]|nr:SDR family oxidoreductase [Phycisphaerales bacterium]